MRPEGCGRRGVSRGEERGPQPSPRLAIGIRKSAVIYFLLHIVSMWTLLRREFKLETGQLVRRLREITPDVIDMTPLKIPTGLTS